MVSKTVASTKEKIMRSAARLFSEKGFGNVSTREIAKTLGLNSASLYYYFASKDELLKSLYDSYRMWLRETNPNLPELMRMAETHPPHEVLAKAVFVFDDDNMEMMEQIIVTAAREIYADSESEAFIRETVFENVAGILRPLLSHMIALDKIEPMNLDEFLRMLSYYCFSAAALSNSSLQPTPDDYFNGMLYHISMIKAKEVATDR